MSIDPVRRLKSMGHDLSILPLNKIPQKMRKVCFICVNSHFSFRSNQGTGPITDSVAFAKCMKSFDFEIYILQTPHSKNFLQIFDKFLQNVEEQLIFFYAGQPLVDPDETDSIEEMHFVFDDGSINESLVLDHIIENKNQLNSLYLFTERCHKGSIFDINNGMVMGKKLPQNIFSFTCIPDPTSPTQTNTFSSEKGIFTFQITKVIREISDCTPKKLEDNLKNFFTQFGHIFVVGITSPSQKDEPMFYID